MATDFQLGRYGSREVSDLQIFDYKTGAPLMLFDYANTSSQEWAGDRVYATGGQGAARRIKWDGNKTGTLTVETQIFTLEHLAMLVGDTIKKGKKNIYESEVLKVGANKEITLSKTPVGEKETITVKIFANGVDGEKQLIKTLAANTVTLDDTATVNEGDEVVVYYQFESAKTASIKYKTNGFPPYVKIAADSLFADEVAGENVALQEIYYKASMQPNFTVSKANSGDPATLSLVFDLFAVKVDGEDILAETILYEE